MTITNDLANFAGAANSTTIFANGGNVGIGTTSPTTKLDVNGTTALRGAVTIANGSYTYLNNSDNTNQFFIYNVGAAGSTNAALAFVSSTVAERMRIDASGNVGIGTTSPGNRLSVAGNMSLQTAGFLAFGTGAANTSNFSLYGDSTGTVLNHASLITFNIANVEKMRIANTGYVGIGTSTIPYKLTVNGQVYATPVYADPFAAGGGAGSLSFYTYGGYGGGIGFLDGTYATGIFGAGGSVIIGTGTGVNGALTTRLRIWPSGYVSMAQPFIRLDGNYSGTVNFGTDLESILNSYYYSQSQIRGNISWNSAGRVTANAEGVYAITFKCYVIVGGAYGNGRIALLVNGNYYELLQTTGANDGTNTITAYLYLYVGDYVEVKIQAGFDAISLYMGSIHTTFHMSYMG